MKTDKAKQLVRLHNRLGVLLQSLRGKYASDRNRDVAARYNTLREDVKRFVNDPSFDRVVPRAWCLKPFLHIPLAFLILSICMGLAYFLLEPLLDSPLSTLLLFYGVIALVVVVFVGGGPAIRWLNRNCWFSASTIGQVRDRANMLHQYLEDYIALNPVFASQIRRKDRLSLERQLEDLQSRHLRLADKLAATSGELEHLKEELAELRRRESIYLSIIKEAQTSATCSPSLKDREILLESYRRQRTILTKNLTRYQEAKAQHGLDVPVDILNAIDQTQEDLKQIDANIAALEEASKTETN